MFFIFIRPFCSYAIASFHYIDLSCLLIFLCTRSVEASMLLDMLCANSYKVEAQFLWEGVCCTVWLHLWVNTEILIFLKVILVLGNTNMWGMTELRWYISWLLQSDFLRNKNALVIFKYTRNKCCFWLHHFWIVKLYIRSTCCDANLSQFNLLSGNYGIKIRILILMIGNVNWPVQLTVY
jgi:hypothetical protein